MNSSEWRAVAGLSLIQALRMLGMFMILPVFALYARDLAGGTNSYWIGLAIGIYGLAQAVLQIPLGGLSDRIGRKPVIVGGMVLFIIGSLIAGTAHDILWVTIGRFVQGSGAVSAAVSALLADVTRVEVRTQAMAILGAGMGLSFILALVLGPLVSGWIGVDGIFLLTAVLGLLAIPAVIFGVPSVPQQSIARGGFRLALADGQLLRLDGGIFLLHACMTCLFLAAPFALVETLNLPKEAHWKVYLPVLIVSILPVFPAIRWAERSGNTKPLFISSIVLLSIALLMAAEAHASAAALIGAITVFFIGFNFLEGSLPSLISRRAPPQHKGAALGIYASSQFLGGFAGSAIGGFALHHWGYVGVFAAATALPLIWLSFAVGLQLPAAHSYRARGQAD
jgi:MFS family permease